MAVALGIVPFAVGFDGGGSVRIPASFVGTVGLATGFGRLDFGADRVNSMVKGGPIAASVADAAVAYAAMASDDSASFFGRMYGETPRPAAHLGGFNDVDSLAGVRLGIFRPWFDDVSPEALKHCNTTSGVNMTSFNERLASSFPMITSTNIC